MNESAERKITAEQFAVEPAQKLLEQFADPAWCKGPAERREIAEFVIAAACRNYAAYLASSERREPPGGQVDPELERVEIGDYLLSKGRTMPDDDYCMFEAGWLAARIHRAEAAKSAAVGPEPKSPWINVEERLPEKNDEFLVKCSDCDYAIPADWDGGTWNTVRGYGNEGEALELHLVTHWMPMPDPPAAAGPEPAKEEKAYGK